MKRDSFRSENGIAMPIVLILGTLLFVILAIVIRANYAFHQQNLSELKRLNDKCMELEITIVTSE